MEIRNLTKEKLISTLRDWKYDKIQEGFIPTLDLLIQELENNENN